MNKPPTKPRGLGRGLDALLPLTHSEPPKYANPEGDASSTGHCSTGSISPPVSARPSAIGHP